MSKQKPYEALKKENKDGYALAFAYNKMPKCPHCGYEFIDLDGEFYEEGEHELDCPDCDLTFDVSTCVEITFSTDHIPSEFIDTDGQQ